MKKIIFSFIIVIVVYLCFFKESPTLEQEISLIDESVYSGDLILINKETKLQQDPTNLSVIPENIAKNVVVDSDYLLQINVMKPLQEMFEAAAKDGVRHFKINSTYRSGKAQQQLYEENGASYALPSGYSEHQSGLSLDIGSTQGTMDKVIEGDWLAENAAKFGFILRYPENKVDVTGIAFEPWHFRYVGLPHSIIIDKKDLALEEYISFLKNKKEHVAKIAGVTYFLQYEHGKEIAKIPDTENFTVSGDNTDGYIITSIIE
ncbi:M15 family metallopeptidase [Solibacillus silvestris]|uniref:M15 family metallopeptidase n=1 Tax=Solibacillus silvestris TaxID=76853 RepID=UPI003F7E79C8